MSAAGIGTNRSDDFIEDVLLPHFREPKSSIGHDVHPVSPE
jgi:hypothetical protein